MDSNQITSVRGNDHSFIPPSPPLPHPSKKKKQQEREKKIKETENISLINGNWTSSITGAATLIFH